MNLSANKSVIWMRPASALHLVEFPSAERRAYCTPVAPPTGKSSVANLAERKKHDYQGYRVAQGIRPETGRTT